MRLLYHRQLQNMSGNIEMLRFIVFLLLFVYVQATPTFTSTTENPENENDKNELATEKVKINGKTYFFQLRKDAQGNETVYKRVRNLRNDGFAEQLDEVEFTVEDENPREKVGPIASLKSRRRDFLRTERTRLHSVHFLDNEWKYNLNNQYLEIPDVSAELYESMREEFYDTRGFSTIRMLFETSPDVDDILQFNLDCIKNKSDQIIVDAELFVFRSSEFNATRNNEGNFASDHLIRLYQVVPINDTSEENVTQNPDLHKLLNVIYISSQDSKWQVFKVGNIIHNWLEGEENLGFLLSATDSWENVVPLNIGRKYHGKIQPMLILYVRKRSRRDTSTMNLPKPNRKQMERYLSFSKNTNTLPSNPTGCNKHVWYISFQELGWNNFILAPSGFMAFKCKGSCFTPIISSFTNHALLKYMYQSTYTYLRKPCCVPDTMKPLTIMYIDSRQNVAIKIYEDMIVDGCGCR